MTGYSRAAGSIPGISFAIEIKSVNARGLDIRMRMTPGYDALEAEVRRRIGKALTRGSISVNLNVDREGEGGRVVVNKQALEAVMSAIADIAALTNSPRPTPDGILGPQSLHRLCDRKISEIEPNHQRHAAATESANGFSARIARPASQAWAIWASRLLGGVTRITASASTLPATSAIEAPPTMPALSCIAAASA
eukprot:gene61126-81493_t